MLKHRIVLFSLLLAGCSSNPVSSDSWGRYTFDLSGRSFSVSTPKGNFKDVYVSSVDLSKNQKSYMTLMSRAWIFSGLFTDQGGLELIVGLNRATLGDTDDEFLQGIQNHLSNEYKSLRPNGVEIKNIRKKKIGGREWLCFSISNIGSECALKVDALHYVSWRLDDINNTSTRIGARDELKMKIEESVEIAF